MNIFVASFFLLVLLTAPVMAAPPLPQVERAGRANYITGSIEDMKTAALILEGKNYNVHIMNVHMVNSKKKSRKKQKTDIFITSSDSREMMNIGDAGPLVYIRLPPGAYSIEARNGKQHMQRWVTIPDNFQPAKITLLWKHGK
ncbi:MAG: hypothetical protein AB7H77_03005 [Bdellovibrionales bacterium]